MPPPRARFRSARVHWSAIAFLAVFTVFAVAIAYYTMVPGVEAARVATDEEKRRLVAFYRLLVAVLLFILFAGIVLTFRFGRLFFPRPTAPRTKTQYVDAWAESGKRMDVPPVDDEDET